MRCLIGKIKISKKICRMLSKNESSSVIYSVETSKRRADSTVYMEGRYPCRSQGLPYFC